MKLHTKFKIIIWVEKMLGLTKIRPIYIQEEKRIEIARCEVMLLKEEFEFLIKKEGMNYEKYLTEKIVNALLEKKAIKIKIQDEHNIYSTAPMIRLMASLRFIVE